MEDQEEEWIIEKYASSNESSTGTRLRWILSKGLWLGKKVVLTGVVITTAPLVLPPLVVFSALGFAFSVPFGLVFASYACNEKLMSMLLPCPTSSPRLQYAGGYDEDEEEGLCFGGDIVMEEGEHKRMEVKMGGVEMRIYDEQEEQEDVGFGGEILMEDEEHEFEDEVGGFGMGIDDDDEEEKIQEEREEDLGYGGEILVKDKEQNEFEDNMEGFEVRIDDDQEETIEEDQEDVDYGGKILMEDEEQELEDEMGGFGIGIDDDQEETTEEEQEEDVGYGGEILVKDEEQNEMEDNIGGFKVRIDDDQKETIEEDQEDVGYGGEILVAKEQNEMEDRMGGFRMRIDDDDRDDEEEENVSFEGEFVKEVEDKRRRENKISGTEKRIADDHEEKDEQEQEVDRREIVSEEEQQREDTTGGVEMRIELDVVEVQADELHDKGMDDYKLDSVEVIDGNGKEVGYEEDVGEYSEMKNKEPLDEIASSEGGPQELVMEESKDGDSMVEMRRVVVVVEGNDKNGGDDREVKELILVAIRDTRDTSNEENVIENEKEEIVTGSTGLPVKIRDGVKDGYGIKESEGKEGKSNISLNASEKPFEDQNAKSEEIIGHVKVRDVTILEESDGGVEEIENVIDDKLGKLNGEVKGVDREKIDVMLSKENEGSLDKIEKPFEEKTVKIEMLEDEMKWTDLEKCDVTVLEEIERSREETENPFEEKNMKLKELNGEVKRIGGEKEKVTISEEEIEKPVEYENVKLEKLNGEVKGTDGDKRDVTVSEDIDKGMEEIDKQHEEKNVKLENLDEEVKGTDGEKKKVSISKENEESTEEIGKPHEEKNVKMEKLNEGVNGTDAQKNGMTISKEIERPYDDKNEKSDKLNGNVKGTDGGERDMTIPKENERPVGDNNVNLEILDVVEGTNRERREVTIPEEIEGITVDIEKAVEEKNVKLEKHIGKMEGTKGEKSEEIISYKCEETPEKKIEGKVDNVQNEVKQVESITEEQKSVVQNKSEEQERKENMIPSNVDAREITDESGITSNNDGSVTSIEYSYTAIESLGVNDNPIGNTGEENTDFLELPVSVGAESKYTEIASEKEPGIPSNEVLISPEKIWEQIDALRVIVGYKSTPHRTYVEELKALYIFTGIEPPLSFKNPSDLDEVNDKLHFLMSIVGVK